MASQDLPAPAIVFRTSTTVVTVGPLWVDPTAPWRRDDGAHDFIFGPIVAMSDEGERYERTNENGFEGRALALFRDGLLQLVRNGRGTLDMADHDGWFLTLRAVSADGVAVTFDDLRSDPARFGIDFGVMSMQAVTAVADEITEAEAVLGPFTGYCDGCGEPKSMYRE